MRGLFGILTAVCILGLVILTVLRISNYVDFYTNCEGHLKRAADANSIDLAKQELGTALKYMEENKLTKGQVSIFFSFPKNDIGFWYTNIKSAHTELETFSESTNLTKVDISNQLIKLRETLLDTTSEGTEVTCPEGISIYPHNKSFFWLYILSTLLGILFGICFTATDN